jgi:predicted PurR-regulated permease PerM
MDGLGNFIIGIVHLINDVFIPFLLAIAFLIFVVQAIRYFVLGSGDTTKREQARAIALWSVLAFVFIVIFWGIINILSTSFNLVGTDPQVSDYINQQAPLPDQGCDPDYLPACV